MYKDIIIFDLETTGLDVKGGHKIIEIGAIKIKDFKITNLCFNKYINPKRSIPKEAVKIHGITEKQLCNKSVFEEEAQSFLDFIGSDLKIAAHNVNFDKNFLNYELKKAGFKEIDESRFIDTLEIAKKKFLGEKVSLDSLCNKYSISLNNRKLHGALLDSKLLAKVYLKMIESDRQENLNMNFLNKNKNENYFDITSFPKRSYRLTESEINEHKNYIKNNLNNPIWYN